MELSSSFKLTWQRSFNILLWALLFLIILLPILHIHLTSFLLPMGDEYDATVPMLEKNFDSLRFDRLIKLHNEHRLVWTRLCYWLHYALFPKATNFIFWCSYILQLGTFFIFITFLRRSALHLGQNKRLSILVLIVIALLIFPSSGTDFWKWSFSVQFPITLIFVFPSILILATDQLSWTRFAYCVLFSLMATLGSANGLVTWPLCALILLTTRRPYKMIFTYCLIGATTIYLYSKGMPHADITNVSIKDMLIYFFSFLGNFSAILPKKPIFCCYVGVIAFFTYLFVFCYLIKKTNRREWRVIAPWLFLGAFSLSTALLGCIQRSYFGPNQSLSTRYITCGTIIFLSLLAACYLYWPKLSNIFKTIFMSLFIIFFLLLLKIFYYYDIHFLRSALRFPHAIRYENIMPSEVALGYRVVLPSTNDFYPPGNASYIDKLIKYYHSPAYTLSIPMVDYLNTVLSPSSQEKLGLTLSGQQYTELPDEFKYDEKYTYAIPPGFSVGTPFKGFIKINPSLLNNSSHQALLINQKSRVCGQVFVKINGYFTGFKLQNCQVSHLLLLKDPVWLIRK